jgi:hypothetical protein
MRKARIKIERIHTMRPPNIFEHGKNFNSRDYAKKIHGRDTLTLTPRFHFARNATENMEITIGAVI